MDLSTTYMGFKLPHPLIPGASPMVDNLETVKRLEDASAPMIVMHSLFEEQIARLKLIVSVPVIASLNGTTALQSTFCWPGLFSLSG